MNSFDWNTGSATLVKAAIKGRHNTQAEVKTRLPITPATLLLLKHRIKEVNWESEANVTPKEFNSCLKSLLKDSINYEDGKITSHSFRAGVTTAVARLGYEEELIQLQGCWLSQAYLRYCKRG